MARIVKAALLQTEWTGDKESMIDKHEAAAREAAKQGALLHPLRASCAGFWLSI
jgi:predicted amidohydrolase